MSSRTEPVPKHAEEDGEADAAPAGSAAAAAAKGDDDGERRGGGSKNAKKVPFLKLFAFADGLDCVLMALGSVAACVHGASVPVFFVFFGKLINIMGIAYLFPASVSHRVAKYSLDFVYLGIVMLFSSWIAAFITQVFSGALISFRGKPRFQKSGAFFSAPKAFSVCLPSSSSPPVIMKSVGKLILVSFLCWRFCAMIGEVGVLQQVPHHVPPSSSSPATRTPVDSPIPDSLLSTMFCVLFRRTWATKDDGFLPSLWMLDVYLTCKDQGSKYGFRPHTMPCHVCHVRFLWGGLWLLIWRDVWSEYVPSAHLCTIYFNE